MSIVTLNELKDCRADTQKLANVLHVVRDETIDRAMKTVIKRLERLIAVASERKTKSISTEEIEHDGYEREP